MFKSLVAALLIAVPAVAQTVVTDGDTLTIDKETYRLWGIDAPEMKQLCGTARAGEEAARTLRSLVQGNAVSCVRKSTDRYGRTVAVCTAAGRDLGQTMVRLGMAYAFTRYSSDYVADEEAARRQGAGLHRNGCQLPWEWRAARKINR